MGDKNLTHFRTVRLRPFRYTKDGGYHESDEVVVCPPSFDQIGIHNRMMSHVGNAMAEFSVKFAHLRSDKGVESSGDEGEDDGQIDALRLISMALSPDAYDTFVRDVKRALTNAPRIASVADGVGISEETWRSIGETNGIEGWNAVMSEFVGFFVAEFGKGSQKPSGESSFTRYVQPTEAAYPATLQYGYPTKN